MSDTADLVLLTGAADETGEDDLSEANPARSANVAPTGRARVLVLEGVAPRAARHAWGLIPPWSKSLEGAARMVNARIETVADKPSYRRAVRTSLPVPRGRLVRVAGHVRAVGKQERRPHLVRRADGRPLWRAGIWSRWHPPGGGEAVASATYG